MDSMQTVGADSDTRANAGNNHNQLHHYEKPSSNRCLADLRLTDPADDKLRIQQTKGGIIRASYKWVLEHDDFQKWRFDESSRLLWIKGDAGKGKTMLLCGIIDELSTSDVSSFVSGSHLLSFFFCQGTDSRLNKGVAVLRGLMYLLICQRPDLISHIEERYNQSGKEIFEDGNALSQALTTMLSDPQADGCYMFIDALDECKEGLNELLNFVVLSTESNIRMKWILSSRNESEIEHHLARAAKDSRLSLELNATHVDAAINLYIEHKLAQMACFGDNSELKDEVAHKLRHKADGTFLWVALVIEQLQVARYEDIMNALDQTPVGLFPLYQSMMQRINGLRPEDSNLCHIVLSTATMVYRPLHLLEFGALSDLPERIAHNLQSLKDIVQMCGSFLTIKNDVVYLIHQSVKDFFVSEVADIIFPNGPGQVHYKTFSKSLLVMERTLKRNIYGLKHPGITVDDISTPEPDPLEPAKYSCIYWVQHLSDCISLSRDGKTFDEMSDEGAICRFISKFYLYWLEALGLLRAMHEGIMAIHKLEALIVGSGAPKLSELIYDARRFTLSYRQGIEIAPLQVYISPLIFGPSRSIVKRLFAEEAPKWISVPNLPANWSACHQAFDVGEILHHVTFANNGKHIVAVTDQGSIITWDSASGTCLKQLQGHEQGYSPILHLKSRILTRRIGNSIKIRDIDSGNTLNVISEGTSKSWPLCLSTDGKCIAWASDNDWNVKISDVSEGTPLLTFEGHKGFVRSAVFSAGGDWLASGSDDCTIRIWDTGHGTCLRILEGHNHPVWELAISNDKQLLASGCDGGDTMLWSLSQVICLQAFSGGKGDISFSPDDRILATCGRDKSIHLWDVSTGDRIHTIAGSGSYMFSIDFSADGQRIVSASYEGTVEVWDANVAAAADSKEEIEKHTGAVWGISLSADGTQLASGSEDHQVKLWDPVSGGFRRMMLGHGIHVRSVALSSNGQLLASADLDGEARLWNVYPREHIADTEVLRLGRHGGIKLMEFSHNGKQLATGRLGDQVHLWDATDGSKIHFLSARSSGLRCMAFAYSDTVFAAGYSDGSVQIWDTATGQNLREVGLSGPVNSICFSMADDSHLYTNLCNLELDAPQDPPVASSITPAYARKVYYGVDDAGVWIMKGGKKIIWLPSEYRAGSEESFEMVGMRGALGCRGGRVLAMEFFEDSMDF